MKRLALFILTLLAAAGCTRTRSEETVAPPPPPERAASSPQPQASAIDNRPVIVAFGDSLSEGFGAEPGKSFPDFLQSSLDREGYRYHVVNMGVSGDTTTGGLGRVDTVIAAKPEMVLLELGGNDGLRGVPVSQTKANLDQMITQLRGAGIRVVLAGMSLPPNYGKEYIQAFESMYRDLARQHKLTLIPFLFEDLVREVRARPGLMQRDGIHPTAAGNEIMAQTVLRYLRPALRKS